MRLNDLPCRVIRQRLIDVGVAVNSTTAKWSVFAPVEPSSPDDCITVQDTVGTPDVRSAVDMVQEYHPGIQVRVRAVDEEVGKLKAEDVRAALEQIGSNVVTLENGNKYSLLNAAKISDAKFAGREAGKTKRVYFTINCTLAVREIA